MSAASCFEESERSELPFSGRKRCWLCTSGGCAVYTLLRRDHDLELWLGSALKGCRAGAAGEGSRAGAAGKGGLAMDRAIFVEHGSLSEREDSAPQSNPKGAKIEARECQNRIPDASNSSPEEIKIE